MKLTTLLPISALLGAAIVIAIPVPLPQPKASDEQCKQWNDELKGLVRSLLGSGTPGDGKAKERDSIGPYIPSLAQSTVLMTQLRELCDVEVDVDGLIEDAKSA
ncbi:hypothetical protein BDV10DRAFT_87273 [Aspergillus recurvatus]